MAPAAAGAERQPRCGEQPCSRRRGAGTWGATGARGATEPGLRDEHVTPGWRAECGRAAGACCASLGGEEQLPTDLPQSPVGGAPCASKCCSWLSSAAELCHSSAQMLNPWINCQRMSVHKHVHSWEAGLLLTHGMLLAPLYMVLNSVSEPGHCGLPAALPIPSFNNGRSRTYPEVFFIG